MIDIDTFVPSRPVAPTASPEVGLASLVVDAWIYRESTARFSRDGKIDPNFPDAWPIPQEQRPDWHETYAEELERYPYFAGLVLRAHGDLGEIYAAAGLSKRESQTFGLRLAGMSWASAADEMGVTRATAQVNFNRAIPKIYSLCHTASGYLNEETK